MNKDEFEQVISLPANQRYAHFIAKVADWEELWTLRGPDGFVLFEDDEAHECVPVWPHPEYAVASATESWAACVPERLDLDAFLDKWVSGMVKDGRSIAVFPASQGRGVVVEPERLQEDLSQELEQYE